MLILVVVCTEFIVEDCIFLDTWAALNDRCNKGILAEVISYDGGTLHKDAEFAARHGHPALSSYLTTAAPEDLVEVVGVPSLSTRKTRLIHIAASHHQYGLVQELLEANADPHCENDVGVSVLSIAKGSTQSKPLREWAVSFGAFLGRYHIDPGPPVHRSATCEVVFATECSSATRVALKLMKHQEQFSAEISGRQAGQTTLPSDVVISVSGWHTPEGCSLSASVANTREAPESTPCGSHPEFDAHPFVLVMQCADRSLHDACAKERIAGFRLTDIRDIAHEVAVCVQKLHSNQMCHGDLKQRNVIRLGEKWVLCDMDAAAHFEEPIGGKTSTAYCPPELYQLKHSQHNESTTILNASASFDVWSFGVLLFELCSGQTLFSQDIANDELVSTADRMRLCSWHTISDEELEPVLRGLAHGSLPRNVVTDAKHLIRWCLKGNPTHRPSLEKLLAHRFLCPHAAQPSPPLPMQYHAFLSHAQADASGTVATLFHEYKQRGLHCWLDMRQDKLTLDGMRQGVRDSQVFLLVLSERVLSSWFCQQEMLTAILEEKKIQLVIEEEPRFHPFDRAEWEQARVAQGSAMRRLSSSASGVGLPHEICTMVDANLPRALTFRRRDFELHAMMHELCRRNGVVLPSHHSTSLAATSTTARKVAVIHNAATAGVILLQLEDAIAQASSGQISLSSDASELGAADAVLLVLTQGVLTAPSPLQHLVDVIRQDRASNRDRIVAVFSQADGWRFGCDEQRQSAPEVQACIDAHEAIAFRPVGEIGERQFEFDAMMGELLSRLGTTTSAAQLSSSDAVVVPLVADVRERLSTCERELAEKDEVIAAKDEVMAEKDEEMTQDKTELATNREGLAAKDDELAAKDAEIAALKAQLLKSQQPSEGVPPHL